MKRVEKRTAINNTRLHKELDCEADFDRELPAATTPGRWKIKLNDLASRFRALPVLTLASPDDALLRALLVKLFADRQLRVDESLIGFLTTRIERSFASARAVVDTLDREALRRHRPVTRALAVELLRGEHGS